MTDKKTIQELIKEKGLMPTVEKYRIQVIHEDNDTYVIEDLKCKRSMVHGNIVHTCKTKEQVIRYLTNLSKLDFWFTYYWFLNSFWFPLLTRGIFLMIYDFLTRIISSSFINFLGARLN